MREEGLGLCGFGSNFECLVKVCGGGVGEGLYKDPSGRRR